MENNGSKNLISEEIRSFINDVDPSKGLSTDQVKESRIKFGTNSMSPPPRPSVLLQFLEQFKDPTIILLSIAALISLMVGFFHGSFIESIGIFAAIFLATGVSFYSEYKSNKEFDILNQVKEEIAKVRRDGAFHTVPVPELVVGDVVYVELGDRIPADGKMVKTTGLYVDESLLSGESKAVRKTVEPEKKTDDETTFKKNLLYKGTLVSDGSGTFIITAVGDNTEMGRIAASLSEEEQIQTPLQERLETLSKQIGLVGFTFATLIFFSLVFINYTKGAVSSWNVETFRHVLNYFMVAVTVVVVAVPEGLPMMVTMSLAFNMRKLTRANCLVKKLSASETIGSVTVICSDKTGTLTQNRMKPVMFFLGGETYNRSDLDKIKDQPEWDSIVKNSCINSTANLELKNDTVHPVGNATEGALLGLMHEMDYDYAKMREEAKMVRQIPFSSTRKRMVTVVEKDDDFICYEKGAPSILLEECSHVMINGQAKEIGQYREQIDNALDSASENAYRVLAFTEKMMTVPCDDMTECCRAGHDHVLTGLVGIADPLRPHVYESVETCHEAGIDVKMVTGDDLKTAKSIARQCRILKYDHDIALHQKDFEAMPDHELDEKIQNIKVLARSRPADKLRLVKSLHNKRETVGVTGDGTNDAPALRQADVGISMGKSGTSVAKEASDIVLLDDNFKSIVSGILWGRTIYENIQRLIQFQLTVNLVALLVAFIGPFIGENLLPLTVVQLLWVNIIMDTFAALALSTEPSRPETLKQCPRPRDEHIITGPMAVFIGITGLYMTTILLILLKTNFLGGDTDLEQLTILFTTLVMFQFWNEFNCRSLSPKQSPFEGLTKNPMFIAIVAIIFVVQILVVNFGGQLFRTTPIPVSTWINIVLLTALVLPVGFAAKWVGYLLFEKDKPKVCKKPGDPVREPAKNVSSK